jgi:hypothetical protein
VATSHRLPDVQNLGTSIALIALAVGKGKDHDD